MRTQLFRTSTPHTLETAADDWAAVASEFSPVPHDLRRFTDELLENWQADDGDELRALVEDLVSFGEDLLAGMNYAADTVLPGAKEALESAIYSAPYALDPWTLPHPIAGPGARALSDSEKLAAWHDSGFECSHPAGSPCSLNEMWCEDFVEWNNTVRYREELSAMSAAMSTVQEAFEDVVAGWAAPPEAPASTPGTETVVTGPTTWTMYQVGLEAAATGYSQGAETFDYYSHASSGHDWVGHGFAGSAREDAAASDEEVGDRQVVADGLMGGAATSAGGAAVAAALSQAKSQLADEAGQVSEDPQAVAPGIGAGLVSAPGAGAPVGVGDRGEGLGGAAGAGDFEAQEESQASFEVEPVQSGQEPTARLADGSVTLGPYLTDQIPDSVWADMAAGLTDSQWEQLASDNPSQVPPQLAALAPASVFSQFPCNGEGFALPCDPSGRPLPFGVVLAPELAERLPSEVEALIGSYDFEQARAQWERSHPGSPSLVGAEFIGAPMSAPLLPILGLPSEKLGAAPRPMEDSADIYR
ncbi:hypothetical protein [Natronoglycomyces albus]|uniref:Uncharacterized protein n=1 Tax=Natronoglycomyces albus TaxID=2811108 RepID=A0A895XW47_9ACTN|nr:hypothetical protein [Natronoglycomyces albus]QSB05858.1 hypothetical protein JQS30_02720 [Natronoglycomyces albus]